MTGEITLRGRILPVGGVREKVLAGHRVGLKTIVLPKRNDKDLVEVPKQFLSELEIVHVEHMDKVLDIALLPSKSNQKGSPTKAPIKSSGDQPSIHSGA